MLMRCSLLISAALLMSACGGSGSSTSQPAPVVPQPPPTQGDSFQSLQGSVARQSASADQSQLLTLATNNNRFTTALYQQQAASDPKGNLVMSAFSVSNAFAMLYAGSANETKREIADVLSFEQQDEVFHQAFNSLNQSLLAIPDNDDFTLNIVNAQWGESTYDFNDNYLNTLSQYYGADIKVADIIGKPDDVREAINGWVEEQTQSLIKDLLPQGAITSDSRLVLTNAVYFNAKWLNEFHPEQTRDAAFTTLKEGEVQVPTMSLRQQYKVFAEGGEVMVELPYRNTDWSMFLITAPVEQFAQLEQEFDLTALDTKIDNASMQDAIVHLPKFSFGSDVDLKQSLEQMGVTLAFSPSSADFSPINQRSALDLHVNAAVHKAFITVDEAGTEAGAATAIGVGVTSIPPEYRFSQPFLFVVKHKPTNTTLFMGRVTNPLQ